MGATPIIAVDVVDEKLHSCRALGATHTINAATEDVVSAVKAITGSRGADVAIEALGRPSTFLQALNSVRDGGKAVMVGIAPVGTTADVDITRIVRRNIKIIGSYGAKARADLPTVVSLAAAGLVDVASFVTQRFALEEAGKAYELLHEGKIVGRGIVDMEATVL
eukprot:TRINITY_DN78237_c0_g1_i1.p1 TRINITY_DN78237_c0_g1~~TRINITY_DN78237_c0_g1_i1.p1  ORF type:complete len:176 (-),score=9.52 TRINITY_DN78237_c0_g1_i1:145-639(-)